MNFASGAVKARTIPGANYAIRPYPGQPMPVVKDFNGDGTPDLPVSCAVKNAGNGAFGAELGFSVAGNPDRILLCKTRKWGRA